MIPKTGEIWRTDFGVRTGIEPAGVRPALVVGPPEDFGPDFPYSIVVPLTAARRGLAVHVEIEVDADNGLEVTSYAQCEQVRSLDRARLLEHLGAATVYDRAAVAWRISTLLDDWS